MTVYILFQLFKGTLLAYFNATSLFMTITLAAFFISSGVNAQDDDLIIWGSHVADKPIMAKDATPIKVAYFHYPPQSFAPLNAKTDFKGSGVEMFTHITNTIGINVYSEYLPASRLFYKLKKGTIDWYTANHQLTKLFEEDFYCGHKFIDSDTIIIYQNIDADPTHITDPASTIFNSPVMVPKESRVYFEKLLPSKNTLIDIVKPKMMAKMFSKRREAFMMDYGTRAEYGLQSNRPSFPVKKHHVLYTLSRSCINRRIPNAKVILDAYINAWYAMENTPLMKAIEKKYKREIDWAYLKSSNTKSFK